MTSRTLIEAEALAGALGDPRLRVFDCRFDLARPAYGRGAYVDEHLPGALHADLTLFLEITYGSVPLVGLFFSRMVPRAITTSLVGYGFLRLMTGKNVLAWLLRRELQKEL